MNIVVCVKPTPDVNIVSLIQGNESQIDGDDLVYMINPCDLVAVEEAVRIKEAAGGGKIVIVSMSPPSHEKALRRCLALGADEAIRIWDRQFEHADSHITGVVLAKAIAGLSYDLILCGRKAVDTDDGQVGYVIAEQLDLPIVSGVTEIKRHSEDHTAIVEKKLQKGYREKLEVPLPALFAVEESLNEPRYASLPDLMTGLKAQIRQCNMRDLGLTLKEVGPAACRKKLLHISTPKPRPKKVFTPDSSLSAADRMALIMSGGVEQKNQELFEGTPETLSVKFIDYLEQLNIDWGLES
ncbi:electron transfer flavoprotein subunit beta/FixA family protein [Thermodesulfobacteriota bacterium]